MTSARPALAPLSKDLTRLLSAAVVSPTFRRLLLSDPAAALAAGYNGENFRLSAAEYAAVTSLRARTIPEFAAQLLHIFQSPRPEAALEPLTPHVEVYTAAVARQ
ncbi:MAG: hypothetical protein IT329_17815 [Caldilineaceae bacterium]|nr:hypothetical protein [Caldilineaceae bacterium]